MPRSCKCQHNPGYTMDGVFALYRNPYASEYTYVRQTGDEPLALHSYEELAGRSGFVFTPFRISAECPLLLISPDIVERRRVDTEVDFDESLFHERDTAGERNRYGKVFARFHEKLGNGDFSKIVLSRCSEEESAEPLDCKKLFMRACVLYPRMFIALVSMPQCGTWLMATPEILLESHGSEWHTMSLAGTMAIDEGFDTDAQLAARKRNGDIREWSGKNIREQRYVSSYVKECLQRFTSVVNEFGPYSVRAGFVKHLRSDFYFNMQDGYIGKLIGSLHPTPAVCGMPKADTYGFICGNEAYERKYYSGFTGPLCFDGSTHLYVILRCMQIDGCKYRLYAGGGLLADSIECEEWLETEAKMETMRKCLAIRRM